MESWDSSGLRWRVRFAVIPAAASLALAFRAGLLVHFLM
jgi:hypothetical protein